MSKFKEIAKGVLSSHITWALVSFAMVLVFVDMAQSGDQTRGETIGMIVSTSSFILFGLGTVGLSIFNLIGFLGKKLITAIKKLKK